MNRWSSNLLTIVFCLIVAGLGTKFALAQADARKVEAAPKPTPTATPTPTAVPSSPPTAAPVVTIAPTPVVSAQRTATTNDFVHMRAAKSTSSAIVVDLQGGTVVVLGSDATSLWQEATYGQYHGYIWKSYLNY